MLLIRNLFCSLFELPCFFYKLLIKHTKNRVVPTCKLDKLIYLNLSEYLFFYKVYLGSTICY